MVYENTIFTTKNYVYSTDGEGILQAPIVKSKTALFSYPRKNSLCDKARHGQRFYRFRHVCHRLLPIPCRIRYRLHQSLAHSFSPVRYKGNIALGRPRESMQIGGIIKKDHPALTGKIFFMPKIIK